MRQHNACGVTTSCVEALERRALLNAGDVDQTFGAGGVFKTTAFRDSFVDLVALPGGAMLAAGNRVLAKIANDGTLDTSFGGGDGFIKIGGGIVLQDDGKILLASSAGVYRFTPEGTLDTSFGGGDGLLTDGANTFRLGAHAIYSSADLQTYHRFTADGVPDSGWDSPDLSDVPIEEPFGVRDFAVQPDGKLALLVIWDEITFTPPQLHWDKVIFNTNGSFSGLNAGHSSDSLEAEMFTNDGEVFVVEKDADGATQVYGDDWFVPVVEFGGGVTDYRFVHAAPTPDDKLIVSATLYFFDGASGFGVARVNSDGSLDETFSFDGVVRFTKQNANHVDVRSDGNIFLNGSVLLECGPNPPAALFDDGDLLIDGTGKDDRIGVGASGDKILVKVNGFAAEFAANKVKQVKILGRRGNDRIVVGAGHFGSIPFREGFGVNIYGGLGDDVIYGGAGDDYIDGGLGRDLIFGGDGHDHFAVFDGQRDSVYGGHGSDSAEGDRTGSPLDWLRQIE